MPKTVLITGAGGGLGLATARRLSGNGWTVIGADHDEKALEPLSELAVKTVQLDVTDDAQVERALGKIRQLTDSLDAIVNFAGVLGVGSVAEISVDKLARVLDVNVLGTFRVNRAFLPLVLAAGGRIVNISSETGWQSAAPFNGPYAMSKHAIEAYSDSLRRELAGLGVNVIKMQPGPFRTAMTGGIKSAFQAAQDESTYFATTIDNLKHLAEKAAKGAHDPDILAKAIEKALTVKNPKAAYSVLPDRFRVMLDKLPTAVADKIWVGVIKKLGTERKGRRS